VKFGLQFQATLGEAEPAPPPQPAAAAEAKAEKPGEVVALDAFRKK
jgi:hypothetical protein